MPTFEFFLDSRGLLTKEFEIDVTATLPKVTVQLFDGDTVVDLTGATVTFTLRDAAGAAVVLDAAATLLDATNGIVEYQLATADVDDVGFFFAQFTITISGESYLIPNDSTQRLRLRIGKEDVPAFSSVPATLPSHAGSHNLGGTDQVALETLLAQKDGVVWVNGERDPTVEGYTADGSFARPFETVKDGVAASYATRGAGGSAPVRETVALMPHDYQIPEADLPIVLTDNIYIVGVVGTVGENTRIRPLGSLINKDIFEVDGPASGEYEIRNVELLVHKSGKAGVHIISATSRFRMRDVWVTSQFLESGVFTLKVDHPSGTVRAILERANLRNEIFNDLNAQTGLEFNFQTGGVGGDCVACFDAELAEIVTNTAAIAGDIRLTGCRIGHEKITGGNAAQKIFASYCETGSASMIANLDALDFQGEHTFQIVD